MRLQIVDETTVAANKPPTGVVEVMATAGAVVARLIARAWGDNITTILHELDGYPIFLKDDLSEAPGALAYHDNDPQLGPYSKVAVGTILANGGSWLRGTQSVVNALVHELGEVEGDPLCNVWRDMAVNLELAQELVDPVQDIVRRISVQPHVGAPLVPVDVPDFVFPSYFNPYGAPPYDWFGVVRRPFAIDHGYQIQRDTSNGEVAAVFGEVPTAAERLARMHVRSRYALRGGAPSVPE